MRLLAGTLSLIAVTLQAGEATPLTDDQKIIHVLNRLGYGPRPGDVERVQAMGLEKYIQLQLHPERVEDPAIDSALEPFNVLKMSSAELAKSLHDDQKAQAEKKKMKAALEPGEKMPKMMADENPGDHPARIAVAQLQNAKIIRAVESNRQLEEVLVDFWSNHFNIDVRKNSCRVLKVVDEREVIRPHVFGKFRDLLEASAKSPAMLVYLDNAQNTAPRTAGPMEERVRQQVPGVLPEPPKEGQPQIVGGINENYAREIMELHTLGVDGGYTQKDVQEVARCFTSWGVDILTGEFEFHSRRHDNGPKSVLGHLISSNGGMKDGQKVLDLLAQNPATAKFIATKLCRRLVSDDPSPALVKRIATVFLDTDGDLRRVVEAIIKSPEFFAPETYRAKIKSPFEFAVSAVRATGGKVSTSDSFFPLNLRFAIETGATFGRGGDRIGNAKRKSLNLSLIEMGQPLYAYQAPTGYPEDSRKWVNSGALIARMNFALALTERAIVDVKYPSANLLTGTDIDKPDLVLDRLNQMLLQGELTAPTRATLVKQTLHQQDTMTNTINVPQLTALILGSPDFQRH